MKAKEAEREDDEEWLKMIESLNKLTHFINVKKLELDEGIIHPKAEEVLERILDECRTKFIPRTLEHKVNVQS